MVSDFGWYSGSCWTVQTHSWQRSDMQLSSIVATRMKDDPKTNMAFVACVRRHPVLYDYTLPGHSSRELQDEAWHRVAMECGDSVGNCKEKWKNLRASLCRHLRQQQAAGLGQRPKKPYYLAEHMEFVVPFTKTRPTTGSLLNGADAMFDPTEYMDEIKQEGAGEEDDDSRNGADPSGEVSADEDGVGQGAPHSASSSWTDHGDGPAVIQVLDGPIINPPKKRKTSHCLIRPQEMYADEADLNFLKSLLPDMANMSSRQKNSFKLAVLSAIDRIVYNSSAETDDGKA